MQLSLRRFVAVKVLTSRATNGKRFTRQWQEAQILARLHHPNIVQIYEVVFHDGLLYLIMEFVEGSTLCERTTNRLLSPREAAELTATLAAAIQAVHEAGIFHRDLKPGNVLMTSGGEPKITDFGLAKQRSNINLLTTQDSILGTPSYMAPEQAAGDVAQIGVASDVYSLGAILYELLAGRPPFLGATVLDTLSQIREREPVPLRHLQPQVPRDVETICLKCLDKAPLRRYISAESLASDLCGSYREKRLLRVVRTHGNVRRVLSNAGPPFALRLRRSFYLLQPRLFSLGLLGDNVKSLRQQIWSNRSRMPTHRRCPGCWAE